MRLEFISGLLFSSVTFIFIVAKNIKFIILTIFRCTVLLSTFTLFNTDLHNFSSCQTETLYHQTKSPLFPLPQVPGNNPSPFSVYEFDYFKYVRVSGIKLYLLFCH